MVPEPGVVVLGATRKTEKPGEIAIPIEIVGGMVMGEITAEMIGIDGENEVIMAGSEIGITTGMMGETRGGRGRSHLREEISDHKMTIMIRGTGEDHGQGR